MRRSRSALEEQPGPENRYLALPQTPIALTPLAARQEADFAAPARRGISPLLEMGAYEALWSAPGTTFRRLAELFKAHPESLPSDFVKPRRAARMAAVARALLARGGVREFGVRLHRASEYPARLRDARNPVELLYFRGWWNLLESRCVAVVGTRRPSPDGVRRARALVRRLVADDWTVVSGLAAGIDTAAHQAALAAGGRTVAVLGTPLCEAYPRDNAELQRQIADRFLVVSQVPVFRYYRQGWQHNRAFFPERNATMSALTQATVIVEAGETSGTLHQARAALHQGRRLLILDSCFRVAGLDWPHRLALQGALRVRNYDDVRQCLGGADPARSAPPR
ncbi:MAG TPA: DNA-processing protein DprA [Thermoanaerobaculia bacterium]|nr:DNA-processing protein DprA [Thermoanaerobaculia bacterium]